MIQQESIARSAQAPVEQAGLLQPVTHLFRAVLQSLTPDLQNSIDLRGDLSNQNLGIALVAKRERGADSERSQVIQAFCDLLLGIRLEQRDKLCLKARCIDNTFSQSIGNRVGLRGQA